MDYKNNLDKILKGEIIAPYCSSLRKHILNHNIFEYKCNKCGIKDWNNIPITLEIEHIDGDRNNNNKNNLELLCPNCHSQTKTYRIKNKNPKKFLSDDYIINHINKHKGYNINQLLLSLNLSNSGGNYKRIHNIINYYNLEIPSNIRNIKKSKNEVIKNRIKIIKSCDIDFNKYGWGVKLSKLLDMTPSASLRFVKRELPEFYKKCWHHKDPK